MESKLRGNAILTAGVVIGVGIIGFFDGILFHQILQIHNMLSAVHYPDTLVNAEINMFWDGLFHAFTWTTTLVGLALLWRGFLREAVIPSTKAFVGSILFGGGLFNLIEGLIDHHILHVHHVVERLGQSVWDYAFLASGVVFMAVGWRMMYGIQERIPVRRVKRVVSH
ncbi:MAG: DUF2243 domain-containing protein [Deltaproteobacteria bacterium]|nr:DUF2243 domain-containing protein [Deltaproteobacteria bacterium]